MYRCTDIDVSKEICAEKRHSRKSSIMSVDRLTRNL